MERDGDIDGAFRTQGIRSCRQVVSTSVDPALEHMLVSACELQGTMQSIQSILWVSVWAQGCSDGAKDGEGRTHDGTSRKDSSRVVTVRLTVALVHSGKIGQLCP